MEYYLAIKKGNLAFRNSMDGPREYYTKCSKPVRGRQIPYNLMESNENTLINKIETEAQTHGTD